MAHFIVEYSANLDGELDVQALFKAMHAAAVETGVFPLAGIRFRARRCDEYLIGDGNPKNAFVHVSGRMGHGRPIEVRKQTGEKLFKALCDHLDPIFKGRPMGISFELAELHAELSYKKNNMHERPKR